MVDSTLIQANAEVMVYNDAAKRWDSPNGNDGIAVVQIVRNLNTHTFRIIAVSNMSNSIVLNCNIHHKLKYHTATPTFHQWRDEHRQVYGLNFSNGEEARQFVVAMSDAINHLNGIQQNGYAQSEYQQIHHDNVYQDPHQHMPQNHSAPTFRDHEDPHGLHPNFRKSSHSVQGSHQLTQQQRRSSQSSNSSSNAGLSGMMSQMSVNAPRANNVPPAPAPPPISNAPPAPPPPPANLATAPVKAPPAPPPPPPNLMAGGGLPSNLGDQLKSRMGNLKPVGAANGTAASSSAAAPPPPAPTSSAPDFLKELEKSFKNRKANQAKADAVDNKSNTSNGSSDSGVFPPATKAKVNGTANTSSPKTHRKAPSASSISSQEESIVKAVNGAVNGLSQGPVTAEILDKFRAELMAEVRLEINKAKQDIIEAIRAEMRR